MDRQVGRPWSVESRGLTLLMLMLCTMALPEERPTRAASPIAVPRTANATPLKRFQGPDTRGRDR
jgi:hypothetical protein